MSSWRPEIKENWQPEFGELGTPLHETTFAIVDLETTGASPTTGAAITEIGAVKVRGGVVVEEFSTFVNPLMAIPSYITDLTGITDQMLIGAPIIDDVFEDFLRFLGDPMETIVVAHNAPFDLGFIKSAAKDLDIEWPKYRTVDTVSLARLLVDREEIRNYKLGTLAAFFNTEVSPNHRALDDAKATVEVLHGLIERLAGHEITTAENLIAFVKRVVQTPTRWSPRANPAKPATPSRSPQPEKLPHNHSQSAE